MKKEENLLPFSPSVYSFGISGFPIWFLFFDWCCVGFISFILVMVGMACDERFGVVFGCNEFG